MGSATNAVTNSQKLTGSSLKMGQSLSNATTNLKKNAAANVEMGAKSIPIVNEASNIINGVSNGNQATAIKNAGLLGLYGVAGASSSAKVAQKSAV